MARCCHGVDKGFVGSSAALQFPLQVDQYFRNFVQFQTLGKVGKIYLHANIADIKSKKFHYIYLFVKSNVRRALVGNLAGKSTDSSSVEYSRTLLQLRLDLPVTLPHDHHAGWIDQF